MRHISGDHVYYIRGDYRESHDPVTSLGQAGKQVLIKGITSYVSAHPY